MTPSVLWPRFLAQGDAALVVEFGDRIDRAVSERVNALAEAVRAAAIPGISEVVPTFRSLLVHFDPLVLDSESVTGHVQGLLEHGGAQRRKARLIRMPVCYDEDLGPDLAEVAVLAGMTRADAARLHASVEYHVYMLGFLPGFPYMGDLPEPLRQPRLKTPRTQVPPRSVAVATALTAIYPLESPGGWRLIGATPVDLFDVRQPSPALLFPGDRVRFQPIDREAFDSMRADWVAGRGRIEMEDAS